MSEPSCCFEPPMHYGPCRAWVVVPARPGHVARRHVCGFVVEEATLEVAGSEMEHHEMECM